MSLSVASQRLRVAGFPRVSGDEPVYSELGNTPSMFSPRERG